MASNKTNKEALSKTSNRTEGHSKEIISPSKEGNKISKDRSSKGHNNKVEGHHRDKLVTDRKDKGREDNSGRSKTGGSKGRRATSQKQINKFIAFKHVHFNNEYF